MIVPLDPRFQKKLEEKKPKSLQEICLVKVLKSESFKRRADWLCDRVAQCVHLHTMLGLISDVELSEIWGKNRFSVQKEGGVIRKTLFNVSQVAIFQEDSLRDAGGQEVAKVDYGGMRLTECKSGRVFQLKRVEERELVGESEGSVWVVEDSEGQEVAMISGEGVEIRKAVLQGTKWKVLMMATSKKHDDKLWYRAYKVEGKMSERTSRFNSLRVAAVVVFCTKYFSARIASNLWLRRNRPNEIDVRPNKFSTNVYIPDNTSLPHLLHFLHSQPPPSVFYSARAWHETKDINGNTKVHVVWRHSVSLDSLISTRSPEIGEIDELTRFCANPFAQKVLKFQKTTDVDFKKIAEKVNARLRPRILKLYNVPYFAGAIFFGNRQMKIVPNTQCNKMLAHYCVQCFCVLSCLWICYCPIRYCFSTQFYAKGRYKSNMSNSTAYQLYIDQLLEPNHQEKQKMKQVKLLPLKKKGAAGIFKKWLKSKEENMLLISQVNDESEEKI